VKITTFEKNNIIQITNSLKTGKVVVLPTDTLYGMSCLATNKKSIDKIYNLKKRDKNKAFIILISKLDDLKKFRVEVTNDQKKILQNNWPAPLTVVFDTPGDKFNYLHNGKNSLGFRIADVPLLNQIINETGPIVSTTVNLSGLTPAKTINEAYDIFGDNIDLYVDNEKMESNPSTVIKFTGGTLEIIRKGKADIKI